HAPVPSRALTPLPGSLSDSSRPSDLRADIKKIADRFFATGSPASDFLDAYVQGEFKLPITTSGIKGLPKVLRRGVVDSQDSGPSLLFLDLPKPPLNVGDPIPERFRSNVLLSKLEGMQAQDLPVFGVSVPDCRQAFSSARSTLLQVCPHMFKDVFMHLSNKLCDLMKGRALLESVLASIVREEFESLRDKLAAHDYPNFSSDSKLRLVIDEAQILSDKNPTLFASSSIQGDPRPMLSPCLHAFRTVGLPDELKIIYCGTGLSMRTLHWALSSGDGVKEYGSSTFPYIEFPGWTGVDSVQAYVDRLKEQLPDNESRTQVDTLIPSAAVNMLHKRLTGRFRPITTAIEGIIKTGVPDTWENAIDTTETMITSWKERERRGNLCGELKR
ncbi:hypothetical protein EC957_011803, partial [Mortierella hygrophila]